MLRAVQVLRQRFMTNLRNPLMRRNVAIHTGGKLIGMAIVLLLITTFVPHMFAHAATSARDAPAPHINAINTIWVLVAAFLVFAMQIGFEMLESGFARQREAVNILVEGIADTCICGITFWAGSGN